MVSRSFRSLSFRRSNQLRSRSQVHFSTPSAALNVLAAARRCAKTVSDDNPALRCAWIAKSSTMFHGLPCFHVERAGKRLKEPKT
ncbi:hypothetical protein V6N13_047643 [Hibiscus sabdariffa]|uniref:Uncharacterized protein n=1 Tax=Hibiscus sabdariffa TaxID=183260 RepID=A0ABR2F4S2_9ROSI